MAGYYIKIKIRVDFNVLATSNTLKNHTTKVYDNISLSTSLRQIVKSIGTVTI